MVAAERGAESLLWYGVVKVPPLEWVMHDFMLSLLRLILVRHRRCLMEK